METIEPWARKSEEKRLEEIAKAMKQKTHREYPEEREKYLNDEATVYLAELSDEYKKIRSNTPSLRAFHSYLVLFLHSPQKQ